MAGYIEFATVVALLTAVAGFTVKFVGLPDQIRQNHKRRSTEGLSRAYWVFAFVSYALWTLHGYLQGDTVLLIGQGAGIITTGIILAQMYTFRRSRRKRQRGQTKDSIKG